MSGPRIVFFALLYARRPRGSDDHDRIAMIRSTGQHDAVGDGNIGGRNPTSFGDAVYSPCAGKVVAARDGFADNPPSHPDLKHPEGNHIVLKCANTEILIAHLLRGSVAVTPGDTVIAEQPLAGVGNSGNSMGPHLHISAKMGESEIPLLFDGRVLSVNDIVRSSFRG